MKPFNLEKAKAGAKVCTKDGHKARIVCYNAKNKCYPLVAVITDKESGNEWATHHTEGGICMPWGDDYRCEYDLMIADTKHEGWINIYKDSDYTVNTILGLEGFVEKDVANSTIFNSKEQAKASISAHSGRYLATIKIEWEE